MSQADLELELARLKEPAKDLPPSNAQPLEIPEAIAYRNAGNVPDDLDRSLRLVLEANTLEELQNLHMKRAMYEPDYHDAPGWRREGSRPVNVVPLRGPQVTVDPPESWLDFPDLREMEEIWLATGTVEGMPVPAAYRGFVYKTVLALKSVGREITPASVADSVARWLPPDQAAALRRALEGAG